MKNLTALFIFFSLAGDEVYSQGKANNWLLGYNTLTDSFTSFPKARLVIDSITASIIPEIRKMPFNGNQANISDENGNLLMATNGCWVSNSTGDTMLNGTDINPGGFVTGYCSDHGGFIHPRLSIFFQNPGDSSKYLLFHQAGNLALNNFMSSELYYSIIDLALDSGRGGIVPGGKNLFAIQDTLNLGLAACKHANGRDWWIVIMKNDSDLIYSFLLTSAGISNLTLQHLNLPSHVDYSGQPVFSPDGTKFSYSKFDGNSPYYTHNVGLVDFDRCNGIFSNPRYYDLTDSSFSMGICFSPNSKYLYSCSFTHVFQINTDSSIIDTIATFDGFASPFPPFYTVFWTMYLGPNGKIYISTSGTLDLHYINYPDSLGTSCDVKQHAIHLPCYESRSDVNHPNYYLGPIIGSTCDSLAHVGINETDKYDFHFSVSPNPVSEGHLKIFYLLPQNKPGWFKLYDAMGREVYKLPLPPWSTLQQITFPQLADGIYHAVIFSDDKRIGKKVVVMSE